MKILNGFPAADMEEVAWVNEILGLPQFLGGLGADPRHPGPEHASQLFYLNRVSQASRIVRKKTGTVRIRSREIASLLEFVADAMLTLPKQKGDRSEWLLMDEDEYIKLIDAFGADERRMDARILEVARRIDLRSGIVKHGGVAQADAECTAATIRGEYTRSMFTAMLTMAQSKCLKHLPHIEEIRAAFRTGGLPVGIVKDDPERLCVLHFGVEPTLE